jgi:hypothetical protein
VRNVRNNETTKVEKAEKKELKVSQTHPLCRIKRSSRVETITYMYMIYLPGDLIKQ